MAKYDSFSPISLTKIKFIMTIRIMTGILQRYRPNLDPFSPLSLTKI